LSSATLSTAAAVTARTPSAPSSASCFDEVGLRRVWLVTYANNARARRAYEKAGFREEGTARESDWVDGRWLNSAMYGILEHEFRRGASDA
jgi:RimJ/RimL family protein N-acetyltransferase